MTVRLVASVICRNEFARYLTITIPAIAEYADEIRVIDDGSDDGSFEWLQSQPRVVVRRNEVSTFFEHEGKTRQQLLEFVLEANPTHVISLDCDELVADGKQLRAVLGTVCPIVTLRLEEVWKADADGLSIREDGGWRPHNAPVCYRVPATLDETWRIQDRALACGREPLAVRALVRQGCWEVSGTSLQHWGWVNESERVERHQRYVVADGGRYHSGSHLSSILWPDSRVKLAKCVWPEPLLGYQDQLLKQANRVK